MKKLIKLGIYQHYKGCLYEVIGIGHHSETLEEFVVYRALYDSPEFGKNAIWVRPYEMFLEEVKVSAQGGPASGGEGKKVPRFKYVENIKN